MKKGLKIGIIVVAFMLVTGCGSKEVTECSYAGSPQSGMKVNYNYKITSQKGIVEVVETKEVVSFSSVSEAESFKELLLKTYEPYKNLRYYNYDVTLKDMTVTSKASINYKKINIDKLLQINENNGALLKDGKVNLDDSIKAYEAIGAVCKTK
ncbi:MAG: YehR family protein [Bacilli bacterium]|nr:YehR family protein [Bacilli bacterium]